MAEDGLERAEDCLEQMIEALALEIKAIKKRGGTTAVELQGGEFRGFSGSNYLYAFRLAEDLRLRDDVPVRVTVGQEEAEGVVVSVVPGTVIIALDRDFGPRIALARVVADDSYLLECLKKRLEEVESGETSFNRTKAFQALGECGISPLPDTVAPPEDPWKAENVTPPNALQARAIGIALRSEVTYLWGPPGTGKTHALARIVGHFYRQGLSVLLVSNTNIAVDTALERVAELLKDDPDFSRGSVLRHGPMVKDELKEKYGDSVDLHAVVERLAEPLRAERAELVAQKSQIERQLGSLRSAVKQLEGLQKARSTLERESARLESTGQRLHDLKIRARTLDSTERDLEENLARAQSMSALRRFFSGLDPRRLESDLRRVRAEIVSTQEAALATEEELIAAERAVVRAREQATHLELHTRNYPPLAQCRQEIKDLEKRVAALEAQIAEIDSKIEALRNDLLRNCRVLATTVYRTYLKDQVRRTFDVVVIDEASMVALPMVFYTAGLARKAVVIAGDFLQLPAIVTSREQLVRDWIKLDVFRKAGIERALASGHPPPTNVVALRTQYRMHEDICRIVNTVYYEHRYNNPLETDTSAHGPARDIGLGRRALLYIDTSEMNPWASLRMGTYSRYNILHALLACNLACELRRRGYLKEGWTQVGALGIVSPYAAQVRLIQKLLQDAGLDGVAVASTVHRFQGNEKEAMVLDLSDSTGVRPSHFVRGTDPGDDGARLLNVAVSRPRRHLILVGNFQYLRERAGARAIVLRILDLFEENGEAIAAAHVLSLGPENWLSAFRHLTPTTFDFDARRAGLFNEGTFFPAFQEDVSNAERYVAIFSPFITQRGAARLADPLRVKVEEGVAVRVVTRPPKEQGPGMEAAARQVIQDLMRLGVTVDLRKSLHEKVAVIDGHIMWHGSLNIFSHRDSTESMMRIPGPETCERVAEFVSIGAHGKKTEDAGQPNPAQTLAERENPECPNCGHLMVLKDGKYGKYFECIDCSAKLDVGRPGPYGGTGRGGRRFGGSGRGERSSESPDGARKCPKCGSRLVRRNGRFGPFLGCPRYPKCRYTENL